MVMRPRLYPDRPVVLADVDQGNPGAHAGGKIILILVQMLFRPFPEVHRLAAVRVIIQAIRQRGPQAGYDQQIKSEVADVKNIGGRPAGTITAAAFLKKFAKDFKWAHLDIAGTAWLDQARAYSSKGASGVGVRLLIAFLERLTEGSR